MHGPLRRQPGAAREPKHQPCREQRIGQDVAAGRRGDPGGAGEPERRRGRVRVGSVARRDLFALMITRSQTSNAPAHAAGQ